MKNLLSLSGAVGAGLLLIAAPVFEPVFPSTGPRPNILFINWELYDLQVDPAEMRNVYSDPTYAETAKGLRAELARLKAEVGDTDEAYPELGVLAAN